MKRGFYIIFMLAFSLNTHAQFLNSIGITAGVTYGNERWNDHSIPDSERKYYLLGYNASLMAEFLSNDYLRWVLEFQFNQKGSIDNGPETQYTALKILEESIKGTEKKDKPLYTTKMDYLCFNNYLKLRKEMLRIIPYVLIGPRIEYKLSGGSPSPRLPDSFIPIHLSLAVGAGVEFVAYGPFKLFVEAFYNPDLMKAYSAGNIYVKNNALELRVGVKYVFSKRRKDQNCNSPTYVPD